MHTLWVESPEFAITGDVCREADAFLITAAPDLYEAALDLLQHHDRDENEGLSAETYEAAWKNLIAAVEKAEGRDA